MRILVVDDDQYTAHKLANYLRFQGYIVDRASTLKSASRLLDINDYCLMLFDFCGAGISRIRLLRKTRISNPALPIVISTGNNAVAERVSGLEAGGDVCISKPIDLEELSARARALLRVRQGRITETLCCGDISLDPVNSCVTRSGREINLPNRQFEVLKVLLYNKGKATSRSDIERHIYDCCEELNSNTVETYIHELRREFGKEFIRTVRGVGYVIDTEPEFSNFVDFQSHGAATPASLSL